MSFFFFWSLKGFQQLVNGQVINAVRLRNFRVLLVSPASGVVWAVTVTETGTVRVSASAFTQGLAWGFWGSWGVRVVRALSLLSPDRDKREGQ